MNEISAVYVPENLSQPYTGQGIDTITPGGSSRPCVYPASWLETQPSYWRGRAYARKPQPGCDPLSKDYAHDMMLVGRYEGMAQQLEGKK